MNRTIILILVFIIAFFSALKFDEAHTRATLLAQNLERSEMLQPSGGEYYEKLASEYDVTLVWTTTFETSCVNPKIVGAMQAGAFCALDPGVIYVHPDQEGDQLLYTVLHELGHAVWNLGECDADEKAIELGGERSYAFYLVHDPSCSF